MKRQRGYVLVITLALLVLAATLMVSIGRAAMRHAASAREAQENLQTRWGAASCRHAVLPHVEGILARMEAERKTLLPSVRAEVMLGGQRFELVLSDESAKANVNAELEDTSVSAAENRLQQALAGSGMVGSVKLRPAAIFVPQPSAPATARTTQPATAPVGQSITSLAQVFEPAIPSRLIGARSGSLAPVDLVTCWGNGSINVHRASVPAMKLALSPPLSAGDIDRLIVEPRKTGATPGPKTDSGDSLAARLVKALAAKPHGDRPLRWTQQSTCHSLWVIGHAAKRDYYSLSVLDESDAHRPETLMFEW